MENRLNYFHKSNFYDKYVHWLQEPTDPYWICVFRILFGFLMVIDSVHERGLEDVDARFGNENYCFFPLFDSIQPVTYDYAVILYITMILGALGIMTGFLFKLSCVAYLTPYLYFFLLDKSRWNNHSYLFALITVLLIFSDAGKFMSIDAMGVRKSEKLNVSIPRWNYEILKVQVALVYILAGIKKLDPDWIAGYSMKDLSKKNAFYPFRLVASEDTIDMYMVHIGGLIYDLTVAFMLTSKSFKLCGFILSFLFHGLNSLLFDIGVFPYVCLVALVLFNDNRYRSCQHSAPDKNTIERTHDTSSTVRLCGSHSNQKIDRRSYVTGFLLIVYVIIQIFLPFSHFLTKGYNNWTKGIYGYSWDMMLHQWQTLHQKISIRNSETGKMLYLDPQIWVSNDRWSSHGDMAKQYAKCIERNLARYNINEIEVYMDIWKSINKRVPQRIFDPEVNILKAQWSPFQPTEWVMPVLDEFSDFREIIFDSIINDVKNWSIASDVIIVVDFPGLSFQLYLSSELQNVTINLISGEILLEQNGEKNITLSDYSDHGHHAIVKSGDYITIHNTHTSPSCYSYTYYNRTYEKELSNDSPGSSEQSGFISHAFDQFGQKLKRAYEKELDHISKCYNVLSLGFQALLL